MTMHKDAEMIKKGDNADKRLIFTYYNPNTSEKTREMIKNIIVNMLVSKNKFNKFKG